MLYHRSHYLLKALYILGAFCCFAGKSSAVESPLFPMHTAHLPNVSVITFQSDSIFLPHSAQFQKSATSYLIHALHMVQKADPSLEIHVYAYCDDIPNAQERQRMTKAQAEAVASYLWSQGLPAERMVYKGLSDTKPLGNPHYVESNALNRRVDVLLLPTEAPSALYPFKE